MPLQPAPFFADLAGGPQGGAAYWAQAKDGTRIRVGLWPRDAASGTVLLFPGRTEYVEKYGDTARGLALRGLATLVIDWRGQGLADRLIGDRRVGHVSRFTDYQMDVAAALDVARAAGMPEPYYLLSHSMGGGIGLRAVIEGLPVAACAFTGPMWGISISGLMRPLAWTLPRVATVFGMGTRLPPKSSYEPYVVQAAFEGNMLTTDPEMYRLMQRQLEAKPELALGGPSLIWLREALAECQALARLPSPDLRCLTVIGENERIVDTHAVHERMAAWPLGALWVVPGAEHEVLMERQAVRDELLDRLARLFAAASMRQAEPA